MPRDLVCNADRCAEFVPQGRRSYCSDACSKRERMRRYRARKAGRSPRKAPNPANRNRMSGATSADRRGSARRGPGYRAFCADGWPERIVADEVTQSQAAEEGGWSASSVSRWMAAWREDRLQERTVDEWEVDGRAADTLEDFEAFRDRYFRRAGGVRYINKDFHRRWTEALLGSLEHGGQQLILSPPRMGKTELCAHLVLWLIVRNPDIRIILVGGNEDIARNSCRLIMAELENNERLIEDFCPSGDFKPPTRSGLSWSSTEFTVSTRSHALKSPTVIAVGRGGRLLSRDADLIVVDDVEDHKSTLQPSMRESTRNWFFTDLASRKVEDTAWVVIGSRQHQDDLYAHLMDNPGWDCIVEQAHDDVGCDVDPDDFDAHEDCLLFPEMRSYRWLMSQKETIGRQRYQMIYQNSPEATGLQIFTREHLEDALDRTRSIGDKPHKTRLIAGLDPASTGYQAAVLWAYDRETNRRYLVDLENEQGGGTHQALQIMKRWHMLHGCRHWVIEENGFQKAIRLDRDVEEFSRSEGIKLEGHETHRNKWDDTFGVTTLAARFENGDISLPARDPNSDRKVRQLVRQFLYFSDSASRSRNARTGYKSDLVMAAWFPERIFDRWRREHLMQNTPNVVFMGDRLYGSTTKYDYRPTTGYPGFG